MGKAHGSGDGAIVRVNYFLPFTGHTGGVRVVFEHVRGLADRGYDAHVVVPASQTPVGWCSPERIVGISDPTQMPDADIVVATASQSADFVAALPARKGEKFYFVQGYESLWCGNVDYTYKLPMRKLVVSKWLQRIMAESFDEESFVVHPAVDHSIFRPQANVEGNGRRVLVMDHATRMIKGTWVAIQAVELARRSVPDLELVVFGVSPSETGMGRVSELHRQPQGEELARLYASCDLFLYPTLGDGFALPPLEAMACGTAVVTTACSGTGDWASDDVCYVTPPHDVRATARAIVDALRDPVERARRAKAGMAKAAEFTWDRTLDALEEGFRGCPVS